jgi:hypothetical protein
MRCVTSVGKVSLLIVIAMGAACAAVTEAGVVRQQTFSEAVAESDRIALIRVVALVDAEQRSGHGSCGRIVAAEIVDDLKGGRSGFEFLVAISGYKPQVDHEYLVFAQRRSKADVDLLLHTSETPEERSYWRCVAVATPFFVRDTPESLIPLEKRLTETGEEKLVRISRVSVLTSTVDLPMLREHGQGFIRWDVARSRILDELRAGE